MVDDRPFGGGPGMVLKPEPVVECVESVQAGKLPAMAGDAEDTDDGTNNDSRDTDRLGTGLEPGHLVMLTPQGRRLTQPIVEELAAHKRLVLLCGRYEGFDDRVREILRPDEISIGDYILGGGETAAMVVIDAVIRLVPDVLGHEQSPWDDSFSGKERWLEGPQYTRPREYRGLTVPEVLLEGNHEQIARWRQEQSLQKTRERRSDLLSPSDKTPKDEIPVAGNDTKGITDEPTSHPRSGRKEQPENRAAAVQGRRRGGRAHADPRRREGADSDLQRHGDRAAAGPARGRCSPSAASCREKASSASSRSTAPRSPTSLSSGPASSAAPSCTSSATAWARPSSSANAAKTNRPRPKSDGPPSRRESRRSPANSRSPPPTRIVVQASRLQPRRPRHQL